MFTVLPGWLHRPCTLCNWDNINCNSSGLEQSKAEEGQDAVGPSIYTAGVPAVEMACGVNLGMSILEGREGSNDLAN
jgi:hypothetical protein